MIAVETDASVLMMEVLHLQPPLNLLQGHLKGKGTTSSLLQKELDSTETRRRWDNVASVKNKVIQRISVGRSTENQNELPRRTSYPPQLRLPWLLIVPLNLPLQVLLYHMKILNICWSLPMEKLLHHLHVLRVQAYQVMVSLLKDHGWSILVLQITWQTLHICSPHLLHLKLP